MSFIGKNIKKIRTIKKLSQAEFAKKFNLARPSVGAYEEGRAEPKIDTVIQIAQEYRLSIDLLLTKELTINELYRFDIFKENYDQELAAKEQDDSDVIKAKHRTAFVPAAQSLEYIVNYRNRDYIESLPWIYLPIQISSGSRAFEMTGSEMEYNHNGLHHGDILVCVNTNLDQAMIKPGKVYLAVTKQEISVRRITTVHEGVYEFTSDDPNYLPIQLRHTELLELWRVRGAYSTYLNPPKTVEEKVLRLEKEMADIKKHLKL